MTTYDNNNLTKNPARSHTLAKSQKHPSDSGRAVIINELDTFHLSDREKMQQVGDTDSNNQNLVSDW